jgi:lipoyl(octanoyl) transferase
MKNEALTSQIEWEISSGLIPYPDAIDRMNAHVAAMQRGDASEKIWLLEHEPLYTLGTSAKASDVLSQDLPCFKSGRGGEVTYHGPGQRVIYVMLDLKKRTKDLKAYVWHLEEWIIQTLQLLGITALRRPGRVGLWVPESPVRDNKIAALGVRISKWVTSHGIALNVSPNLSHYQGIIPCGITTHGVTSLKELGHSWSLKDVDTLLRQTFQSVF